MSTDSDLPAEVTALLHRALPSMVHIEALLMLARIAPTPATRWEIAAEVRSSPALVAAALADLEGHRLVQTVAGADGEQHRLVGDNPAVARDVASLQDVYDRKPVTLIRVMYERPQSPPPPPPAAAQAFADAFRVRPPDDR